MLFIDIGSLVCMQPPFFGSFNNQSSHMKFWFEREGSFITREKINNTRRMNYIDFMKN